MPVLNHRRPFACRTGVIQEPRYEMLKMLHVYIYIYPYPGPAGKCICSIPAAWRYLNSESGGCLPTTLYQYQSIHAFTWLPGGPRLRCYATIKRTDKKGGG